MAEELRPCPFCGGEAKEFTGEDAAPHRWTVECDRCGAHVGSDTRHKARAKWNRRAERTCRAESSHEVEGDGCYSYFEHELSCGHEMAWGDQLPPSYCPECGRRVLYDSDDYI